MSTKNTPNVDLAGHKNIVLNAATNGASLAAPGGSAVVAGFGYGDVYLLVQVGAGGGGVPVGSSIQFSLTPVDPLDGVTPIGGVSRAGPIIVTNGGSLVRLSTTESDTILVQWVVIDAGGPITNVNATLIGKSAGTRNESIIVPGIPTGVTQGTILGFVEPNNAGGPFIDVRSTPYVEPTAAAQRSLTSTSANDTAAGTGARKVRINYYDNTLSVLKYEEVTLNGVTPVNTIATDIRFIESLIVTEVGSSGWNNGIIQLWTNPGGAGTEIGRIQDGVGSGIASNRDRLPNVPGQGDNRTFWTHHYVRSGFQAVLILLTAGLKGNQAGQFYVRAQDPTYAFSPCIQIVPTLRVGAPNQNSILAQLAIPVAILGPALVCMFASQDGGGGNRFHAGFSFSEQRV